MKHRIGRGVPAVLAAMAGLLLSMQIARAELQVIESSVADITVGSTLEDDAMLDVPEGSSLRLLHKASDRTITIDGPYEGTVVDYEAKKPSWWKRIFGGGTSDNNNNSTIGATRGLRAPSQ